MEDAYEAARLFEEEITPLLRDIRGVKPANKCIENVHKAEALKYSLEQLSWQGLESAEYHTFETLQECRETMKRLLEVLDTIAGKDGAKTSGWRDGIKKQSSKQSKGDESKSIQSKISIAPKKSLQGGAYWAFNRNHFRPL